MYFKVLVFLLGASTVVSITLGQFFLFIMLLSTIWVFFQNVKNETALGNYQINVVRTYPFKLPILMYLAAIFISSVFNPNALESLDFLSKVLTTFVFVMIMITLLDKLFDISVFIKGVALGIIIEFVYVSYQTITDQYITGLLNMRLTTSEVVSLYSICILYIILNKLYTKKIELFFLSFIAILSFLTMILLISRTATAVYLLAIAAMFIYFLSKKQLLIALPAFIITTIVSLFLFGGDLVSRLLLLKDSAETTNSSFGTRLELWKISIESFLQNPIIGVGPSNFESTALLLAQNPLANYSHAHNIYLNHMILMGSIGIITFLFLMFKLLSFGYKNLKFNNIKAGFLWLVCIIIVLMNGVTENLWGDSEVMMAFAIILGVIYRTIIKSETGSSIYNTK